MEDIMRVIESYTNRCRFQKNLSDKTIKAYKIDLGQYVSFNSGDALMSKAHIVNYIGSLHLQYKPKTVKRKIASIKGFANYLCDEDLLNVNPFDKIRIKYKEASVLPKTIPSFVLSKILTNLYLAQKQVLTPYSNAQNARDIAVLELLFATGLRISELCSLNLENFNIKSRVVRVMGKGLKERLIQVENKNVLSALKRYLSLRPTLNPSQDETSFFVNRFGKRLSPQSVRFLINRCAKQAKSKIHITPHMFRHTFATMLLEEGVDIRYIQNILGHSSILTTQIYTRVSSKKQKSILLHKHPRNRLNVTEPST